jgi:hypothetical protein
MNEAAARTQLERMVAKTSDPTLSEGDIDALLVIGQRADSTGRVRASDTAWAAGATRVVGDRVVGSSRTGQAWVASVGGLGGDTEPAWPGSGTVADGAVTWTLYTGALVWQPTYDLNAAAAEGWRWKMAKLASGIDFTTDGQSFSKSQAFDHAKAMIEYYASRVGVGVAGARTGALSIGLSPRHPYVVYRGQTRAPAALDEFGDSDLTN